MSVTATWEAVARRTARSVGSRLARLSPRTSVPPSMREATPFLDEDPLWLATVADGVGVVVGGLLVGVAIVVGRPSMALGAVCAGASTVLLVRGGVLVVANARRSRALGGGPTLVSRAVLRMRVEPTVEGASEFAAAADGRLGERLAEHVRRTRGTPRSGLDSFSSAWREQFPVLHRSLTLVVAAGSAPDGERGRTLDRAMDAILEGTRDRAADAARGLQGPVTAVYAFGVLLPLALVSLLPAAGAAGVEATLAVVVGVYDVVLPLGLLCAAGWLVAKRPIAFPPASIDGAAATDGRLVALAGGSAAITSALLVGAVLPAWTRYLAAVGIGAGVALVAWQRPVVAVRRRGDALDASLSDAMYLIGRRISDGVSVERALADAADELDGVTGEVLASAARRQHQLGLDVERSFTGEYGVLESVPSRRAESVARLLGVAARTGPPAGRTIVETADHLEALRRVERSVARELGRVTATLANTAAVFGPLVGGATVALADAIGTTEALDGSPPETAALGLAVGAYVLFLAVVLTALSTGLTRGFDRATVGYRIGAALCAATTSYLAAFHAASLVAGVP